MKPTALATVISSLVLPYALFTPFSFAADSTASTAEQSIDETMQVTATSRTKPVTNKIAPVVVVDKKQIQDMQANTLLDVLRTLPGVQFTQNGGKGSSGKVYVRGSDQVLFLFNGVRLGSASIGYSDPSQIPLTGIERIEYIRGARASIYGADASSGVFNIITSPQQADGQVADSAHVAVTAGKDGYQSYQAGGSKSFNDKYWVNVNTRYSREDGFDAHQDYDADDDGFENSDVIAELGANLNEHWQARVGGSYHKGRTEYDSNGFEGARNVSENYTVYGKLSYQDANFASELTLAQTQDSTTDNIWLTKFDTERFFAGLRNNWQLTDTQSFGFGAEYYNDDLGDSDLGYGAQFAKDERYNASGYLTYGFDNQVFQFESSLRFDDNEQFGDETTWQLGAGWQFLPDYRLTANAGTGFKAPTFNDLYYPGYANPDLEAEESTSYEVALEADYDWLSWRLAGFYQDIDNRISCQSEFSTCLNDDVEIKGVELAASFLTGPVSHNLSFEYLDPEDKSTGKQPVRIARQNATWSMQLPVNQWLFGLDYEYRGSRYDTYFDPTDYTSSTDKLDAYSLVNLTTSYTFDSGWQLAGRLENLLDEDYETTTHYNTQGISYYATLSYDFN